MVKRLRFDALAKNYDFFTKLLMLGTYGRVREKVVASANGEVALDLCCGTGYVTGYLKADKVVGLDLSRGMLEVNKEKNQGRENILLINGDAYNLPLKSESFDLVTCTLATHEFRRILPILKEASRVLKRGGSMVIYDLYLAPQLWLRPFMLFVHHVVELGRCYTHDEKEWKRLLSEAGFASVEAQVLYFASILIKARK